MNQEFEQKQLNSPADEQIPTSEQYLQLLQEAGSEKHVAAYQKVIEVAKALSEHGGQALLVGGCVRDMLQGKISKDFDVEVYKLEPTKIEEIVKQHGKVSDVGKAFGVLKLTFGQGIDIDISLPRTDSKVDVGHQGFEIKTDPNMGVEDAARRRDFTINSMAYDPLTEILYDPFGGARDLRERRLKVTDPERFRDDPLRVLRALQFMSRLGLSLGPDSAKLISEMASQLSELPKERIYEEWKKLLLKSEKPSIGLSAGMALGVFNFIHTEFAQLQQTPQDKSWHPEGDVWVHTLMALDEAAKIVRRESLTDEKALVIMLTTLCHDLGKIDVTMERDGRIISHRHEKAGGDWTENFLASIGVENIVKDKVRKLVENHLVPTMLYKDEHVRKRGVSDGTIRRLALRIHPATLEELVLVSEADHAGRGPFESPEVSEQLLLPDGFPAGPWLIKRARDLQVEKSKPVDLIMGRDLIDYGYKPSPYFSRIIKLANDLRDEKNFTKDAFFRVIEVSENEEEAIKRLENELQSQLILTKNIIYDIIK